MNYFALFFGCYLLLVGFVYGAVVEERTNSMDGFIEAINERTTTWKAGRNIFSGLPLSELRKRAGALLAPEEEKNQMPILKHNTEKDFPDSLDGREKWSECESLKEIRNQGSCGSCWAFATVEVMSDRECIHSKGKKKFHYSANDVVSCCFTCGFGCNGGYVGKAFSFWHYRGVVSGGPYKSKEGCSPYTIPDDGEYHSTPSCVRECQSEYEVTYKDDKHFGNETYRISKGEDNMIAELNIYGPIAAVFTVYNDFFYYNEGVYQHTTGSFAGYHAIKIIGYGEEHGVKYWICANSWGEEWGEQGFFKIKRGDNECDIESELYGGLPRLY